MWTKAQHRKFKQTVAAKKNGRNKAKAFFEQAATELKNIQDIAAPNPARALHETLDAYFGHLGLELKMDAIRYLVVRAKER